MNELEHARQRVFALENALRSVMAVVIELMPPAAADRINRLGWEWDKQLDQIDAEFKGSGNTSAPNQKGNDHE